MAAPGSGVDAAQEKHAPVSLQTSRDPALPHSRQDVAYDDTEAGGDGQRLGGLIRVKSAGESGRRGLHPLLLVKIIWESSSSISRAVNVLWPFVPAALAVYYTGTGPSTLRFALAYIAMVPCANLIGFAGAELARKMPHMLGVLTETTCVHDYHSLTWTRTQNTNRLIGLVLLSKSSYFLSCCSAHKIRTGSTLSELRS